MSGNVGLECGSGCLIETQGVSATIGLFIIIIASKYSSLFTKQYQSSSSTIRAT